MIEYDYPELFEEHESVHFIIVNSGATVSSVSHDMPSISDNEFLITENEMKQEAFSLTESLCSLQNLKFGLGESSHVSFTVYNSSDIPNLKDEEITIYLYFNNDSDTLFEVGTYIIEEDKYSADRAFRDVSGYDVLHYLWDYDITEWYNDYFSTGPKAIGLCRASLFTWLNTQNTGYTINHAIRILPNDSYVIEKGIESDSITFGFFMQGIIEVQGRFLHCTRDGKIDYFKMEWYDKPPVNTYTEETTYPPVKYEDYETWGIGFIRVYNKNNKRLFRVGSSDKQHPSYYNIVDGFVFANNEKRSGWKSNTKSMLETMHGDITHLRYKPCEFKAIGNLCYEVGDRIDYTWVTYDENDQPVTNSFYTYILERTFTGIQGFKDLISAKGDRKQPKLVKTTNNWHVGDSDEGGSGDGTGGVSELDTEHDRLLIQKLRNIGIRMLDEPSNVTVVYNKQTHAVDISWTDPSDISDYQPHPTAWEGTVVVRKDDNAPIHRWDGTKIVRSTTRDQYSQEAYSDDTVEPNKKYYYAIMPYYTSLDDEDHPIRHYTWTKVISVDTERILVAPTLFPIQETGIEGVNVTVAYSIPVLEVGQYEVIKLVAKKDSIPLSIADGDKAIDLTPTPGMVVNTATMTGLDELSTYYFVIFIEDEIGNTASSEPQDCMTGERTTIDFFTDSFNPDLMKDDWDLNTSKSTFGDGSTQWAPTYFSSDFLSSYNFLIGNYNRDGIVEDNGILRNANYNYGASDSIYWIPINRVNGELKGLEWDYCNLRSASSGYDDIAIFIGWVDSNNGWHQAQIAWITQLRSSEWQHGEYTDLSPENPYIDYIGIYTCDGQPACKNIVLTVL